MTIASPDVPSRLLDAAEAIVQARGVGALTIEGAAREAGVSKGGLLYHYASKQALLAALLLRLAEQMSAEFDAGVAAQAPGLHRVARALLAWTFDATPPERAARHERSAAVFLAAHHHDPALLDPVRAVFARIKAALLADGTRPGPALAVLAAGDGLFMAHVFGTWHASAPERAAMRASLAALLGGMALPEEGA